MKIDFKGLGGEKVNHSDLFLDSHGNIYEMSAEGFLYARSDVKAEPAKPKGIRTGDKTVDLSGKSVYKW